VSIGTSLGNYYSDEHHYQAREFLREALNQTEFRQVPVEDRREQSTGNKRKEQQFDDLVNQFLDPTGIVYPEDIPASNELSRALGSTSLDIGRVKQIDREIMDIPTAIK
jgi:hypothetical protein